MVKQYKQKKAVSFARILAPAERSFGEQAKKVTQNSQKCYSKLLTTLFKNATIWLQKTKKELKMSIKLSAEVQKRNISVKSFEGKMFSPYQAQKAGILTIGYYPVDVEIQKNKRDLILLNFDKFTSEQKSIACKILINIERNINFICSMINQQNLERA